MLATFQGIEYRITRARSIYTNRNGLEDCRIMRESDVWHGGAKYGDKLFRTVAVFAAESGAAIRHYERIPPEITIQALTQWGMLDSKAA